MRISKKITFSPSLFVRPSEVFPQLVSHRYYDFSALSTRDDAYTPAGSFAINVYQTFSLRSVLQVMASSFTQSLPYLHSYPFDILLGLTMMCLLTRVIMPLYTVSAWFIQSVAEGSVPSFVVSLPLDKTSWFFTLATY
jgi:hypothetical protein